jgi:hypothetical protein
MFSCIIWNAYGDTISTYETGNKTKTGSNVKFTIWYSELGVICLPRRTQKWYEFHGDVWGTTVPNLNSYQKTKKEKKTPSTHFFNV